MAEGFAGRVALCEMRAEWRAAWGVEGGEVDDGKQGADGPDEKDAVQPAANPHHTAVAFEPSTTRSPSRQTEALAVLAWSEAWRNWTVAGELRDSISSTVTPARAARREGVRRI